MAQEEQNNNQDNQQQSNSSNTFNRPTIGMNLDANAIDLSPLEYSLMVNGNLQSIDGSLLKITNEPSNLLCSKFKPGYLPIGKLYIPVQKKTIFFLVNPTSNQSEIGYITNQIYDDNSDWQATCKDCNHPLVESVPLEDIIQSEGCFYQTIVNASCLNFNINYPVDAIYEIGTNVDTGQPDCDNVTIFFTDFLNPRRYLNTSNWPQEIVGFDPNNCNQPITNGLLDCNKILIDKNYTNGCVISTEIVQGGQNTAGVYQIAAAYSNSNSEVISDYFVVSNPVSIWDYGKSVTVKTDYISGQAISYLISNLDTNFLFLNIVIIKTINGVTQSYLVGTFPINSSQYAGVYTGSNSKKETPITLNEILSRKPIYVATKGLISSNDILFSYNNIQQRVINLQPVVNDLRLQWQTIEVEEGFYSEGTNVANYLSYERDEIYAFGIEFRKSNGYKLPTFLLSANSASEYQTITGINPYSIVNNSDVLSNPNCCTPSDCQLNKLWQVYNIATNNGITCDYITPSSGTSSFTQIEFCSSLFQVCDIGITCDYSTYPYPTEIPIPCCPSGSTNCQTVDLPILITPSGTQITNVYSTSTTLFQPDWGTNVNISYPPSGCSNPPSGCGPLQYLQTTNTYTAINFTANNSYNLYPSTTTACGFDPAANNQSHIPTLFLKQVSSPVIPAIGSCGSGFSDNQVWFKFTAANIVQAITVSLYADVPIVIVGYSDIGITEIGCSTNDYLVLKNLVIGQTYYFVVYTSDPTYIINPPNPSEFPGGILWNWGTICLNTPVSIGTTNVNIPSIYQQTYSYEISSSSPILNSPSCELQTYQYGEFSYWESIARYPNNPDVWGDLCGQLIRHYKMPDCAISNIHNGPLINVYGTKNKIYPIGLRLDINHIKSILNQAVSKNLITEQEKLEITGYSIKRGNRRTNRSIVGKGLLTDVWRTFQLQLNTQNLGATWSPIISNGVGQFEYYPNYFFNSVTADNFILYEQNGANVKHPYYANNFVNGRYTFHGPNTSFNQPFLTTGQELKLETVEYGYCKGAMNEVLFHSKYVLLSKNAYELAEGLAAAEIFLDANLASTNAGGAFTSFIYQAIYFTISLITGFLTNQGKYTAQWAEIFKKLGTPQNPAIYYTGVGFYNQFVPVINDNGARKRASINNSMYLNSGNYQFQENGQIIKFNNFERESSVYLSTDAFTTPGISPQIDPSKAFQNTGFFGHGDTSRLTLYNDFINSCSLNADSLGNIAGYYSSIKNYVPDQYGTIDQIEWIDSGYCGVIDWKDTSQSSICNTIFGGDTFINRFAYKEKMPMFTDDRVFTNTTSVNTDIFYRDLGNIGFPQYYFNSAYENIGGGANAFFQFTPPDTNFLCNPYAGSKKFHFYQTGKCPLYFYTIPYFICESDYNVDLRHGEDELTKNFYPYVGDIVNWTQQYQVPISTDNYYFYNNDYSKQNLENFVYILPYNFANLTDTCQTYHPTRVIYSPQGTQFWLNTLPADFYDFPREDGAIVVMKELEELKVLVLQEQSNKVFNAFVTMQTNAGIVQVTSSKGIFQDNKPSQIYSTDLGFAGCQNREIVSTPHGTFYLDTRNPAILSVTRTMYGRNVTNDILEPREGKSKVKLWFRQNLPFNIIKDYPTVDIDNAWKYFGICTVWDNKFDRLLITKRDARVRPEYKNQIIYGNDMEFYLVKNSNKIHVLPTDTTYFEQKSWTVGMNPTLDHNFISFYSFIPNYYVSQEEQFQSGINFPIDHNLNEIGLWTHGLTQKSFQVFYGELHSWIMEYVLKDTVTNTYTKNIVLNLEMYRYQGNLNWYMLNGKFINQAIVYNQTQSTGLLNIIPVEKNNLYQLVNYPQYNIDNATILAENVSNLWSWNHLYNISRLDGQPLMVYTNNNCMFKEINPLAMDYIPKYIPNRMRGDYFSVRIINSIYSNYKIIMKHGLAYQVNTI